MHGERLLTFDQIVEVALVEDQQRGVFIGARGGEARLVVDEREFAEIGARPEDRERLLGAVGGANDRDSAVENDENRLARIAFAKDRLAGGVALLEKLDQQLAELVAI